MSKGSQIEDWARNIKYHGVFPQRDYKREAAFRRGFLAKWHELCDARTARICECEEYTLIRLDRTAKNAYVEYALGNFRFPRQSGTRCAVAVYDLIEGLRARSADYATICGVPHMDVYARAVDKYCLLRLTLTGDLVRFVKKADNGFLYVEVDNG